MKVIDLLWTHLGAIAGFGLAVFVVLKLLRQRHRPSVTFSWLLGMAVLPWVVAPLYLVLGGRKLRQAVARATELAGRRRPPGVDEPDVPLEGLQRLLACDGLPPARPGNDFEFLGDGETAHARLTELLRGARHSIHVTTFILARDDVARHYVELLARKAAEGVEVRLLVDALGSFLSRGRFLDPLRAAGGRVASFMPMLPLSRRSSANLRNHRKLVVVDGETAWVAGMNLAGEYLGSSPAAGLSSGGTDAGADGRGPAPHLWLDTAAVLTGPVAADLEAVFASDWTFATGEGLDAPPTPAARPGGDLVAQVVPSGPDVPSDGVADVVLSGIADARRRIWLVTPYFVPDDTLLRSLTLQARMGRDVRLIVPRRSDHPLVDLARCRFLRELLAAGATVRSVPDRMVHAKLAVFDDDLAVLGSANLDLRSLYLNFEISVLLHSPAAVGEVCAWIERLDALAQDHTPPRAGLLRTWTEDLAVLISPLL